MFAGSPSREEMQRLKAKLVAAENALSVARKEVETERQAKDDARRALRQRTVDRQPHRFTSAAAPAYATHDLPAVGPAANAERDDALAAAAAAHADAERAQRREHLKTAELAAVRIELAEAQERAQIGEAVFSRSLAADNAEHQVTQLQQAAERTQLSTAAVAAKLAAAHAQVAEKQADLERAEARLAAERATAHAEQANAATLRQRLDGAVRAIALLEARVASAQQGAAKDAEALQADMAEVQLQRDDLFHKASTLTQQVEGLQAALAAKDRRIEDLRSAEAASDAQCQALQEQQKELERSCTTAQKEAEAAEQSLTALRMQAKADADRASHLAQRKDAEIAELHARLQQAQEAADDAKRDAHAALDRESQAQARAEALDAARAAEQRKCTELQGDVNALMADGDVKDAHIAGLQAKVSDMAARLGVTGQMADAAVARAGELAEARTQMAAKTREVGQLRGELDDERARADYLAQARDGALLEVEELRHEVADLRRMASPHKALRMSRSDSEDEDALAEQGPNGGSWPAADAYLEQRRQLHPGSPGTLLHTIVEAEAQEGEHGPASPGVPAGATATVRVTTSPSLASAKAPAAASPSPSAVSPKRWGRRLTGSAAAAPKAAVAPNPNPKAAAAGVRSTPAAIRTAHAAGDQAQSGSPLGWGRAQPPSPVSPAMAAAQALFTSPLSRTATHPPAAAMAAAAAPADPQLRRTLSADQHSGPKQPLDQADHAEESPLSSPASERPLQGAQRSAEASPFTSSPSSTGDKENDDDIDTELDTGGLGKEAAAESGRMYTRRYALRSNNR